MNCSPLGSSVHGILQARILGVLLRPLPGDLPNSGIEPVTLKSPALADGFFSTSTTGKPNQSLSPVNSNSLLWWFENRSPKSLTFFLLRGESMSLCLEIWLLWLFRPIECESVTLWLPRLIHKRWFSFHLIPWNSSAKGLHVVGKPTLATWLPTFFSLVLSSIPWRTNRVCSHIVDIKIKQLLCIQIEVV